MAFVRSFLLLALALLPDAHAFTGKRCRIMPLGASITYGVGSSHSNGYRGVLFNLLTNDGNTVNMVGERKSGDFQDTDHEGWPGFVIGQVNNKSQISMPINRPNIATVLVGTNDMLQNIPTGAPDRLGTLIDNILAWPTLTLVVVSTLPPNGNAAVNTRIKAYNAAIPAVVKKRVDAGRSVIMVDSYAVVATSELPDGTHPNDAAYERIGRVFYNGIKAAEAKGWLFPVDGPPP